MLQGRLAPFLLLRNVCGFLKSVKPSCSMMSLLLCAFVRCAFGDSCPQSTVASASSFYLFIYSVRVILSEWITLVTWKHSLFISPTRLFQLKFCPIFRLMTRVPLHCLTSHLENHCINLCHIYLILLIWRIPPLPPPLLHSEEETLPVWMYGTI